MQKYIYILLMLCIPAALKGQDPATLKKANAGDAEAQYQIANFYLPNTKSTSEEGMKWLIKSAENGHAGAQWALKNAYWDGWYGTIRNESKYVFWLTKLVNHDNLKKYKYEISSAQHDLGEIYKEGKYGIKKDIDEYIRWMKKSFYNDYSPAAFSLGLYYKREGDKEEAIYWLKKCMDLYWANYKEEHEYAFKKLRELGVTYHPADHVGHNHSESIVSSNSTPASNQNQGNQVKAYVETVPVQVWQACGGCNGTGQCGVCYGSGWILSYNGGRRSCSACHGTGKCTSCAGHGGQNVVRYEQRTVYR